MLVVGAVSNSVFSREIQQDFKPNMDLGKVLLRRNGLNALLCGGYFLISSVYNENVFQCYHVFLLLVYRSKIKDVVW